MSQYDDGSQARERGGGETPKERASRKWSELLQELRVAQMGVQILTGFLLTVPFSARFTDLSQTDRAAYMVTVSMAILSAVLLITPVAFHRVLYGRSEKDWLVAAAAHVSRVGLAFLGLTLVGAVFMVFHVVTGMTLAVVGAVVTLVLVVGLWLVTPWAARGPLRD